MAGAQSRHQKTKVRKNQREENVHAGRGSVQRLPSRVLHVPELLPRAAVRGGSRLHVPAPAVPHPVPHAQPPVRLHVRLDDAEAEGGRGRSGRRRPRRPGPAAGAVVTAQRGRRRRAAGEPLEQRPIRRAPPITTTNRRIDWA